METYKYETEISKEGIIKIPLNNKYLGKKVNVLIFPRRKKVKSDFSTLEFLEKWSGFLSSTANEDSRYEYLMEKHK